MVELQKLPPGIRRPSLWPLPETFPWRLASDEVYADPTSAFSEPFGSARTALDYGYHRKPALLRQHLQDVILQRALSSQAKPKTGQRPWCVFTAGAMGVGKSHALLSLHAEALFPLDRFQQIDPDKIKGEVRGVTP